MNFKIISHSDGSLVNCDLIKLSRSIKNDSFILRIEEDGSLKSTGYVTHKVLVYLATEFADYALQNYAKKQIPEAQNCISLVRKWIEDSGSVSNKELRYAADAAVHAAYAAADAAVHAAYAAADATVHAADAAAYAAAYAAADATVHAADAAADAAAYAAAYAARAASAAGKTKEEEYERQ